MKKKIENIIIHLLLLFPLLSIFTNSLVIGIINSIILVGIIIYLIKYYPNKKIFILLSIYFGIYILFLLMNKMNVVKEIVNFIQLFFLPICMLFFSVYENEKINKKLISYFLFGSYIIYLLPIFNNSKEVINLIILFLPLTISFYLQNRSKQIFILLFLILAGLLLKNKIYYLSILLIAIYFVICNWKVLYSFFKKEQLKCLLAIAAVLAAIVVYLPNVKINELGNQIANSYQQEYNERVDLIKKANSKYLESESLEKLVGTGSETLNSNIDVLDIFYQLGIVGGTLYITIFVYAILSIKLNKEIIFSLCLMSLLSVLNGSVLISFTISFYTALLPLAFKTDGTISKSKMLEKLSIKIKTIFKRR